LLTGNNRLAKLTDLGVPDRRLLTHQDRAAVAFSLDAD
jgi:hypothetical protein